MTGRERNIQQKFFVSEQELAIINERQEVLGIKNKSAYYRKMVLDGFMIKKDYAPLKELAAEINRIGVNINQVAHKVNIYGDATREDIKELQARMDDVWLLLRSMLSSQL